MNIQSFHNQLLIETICLLSLVGHPSREVVEGVTPIRSLRGDILYPFNGYHFSKKDWEYLCSVWGEEWKQQEKITI